MSTNPRYDYNWSYLKKMIVFFLPYGATITTFLCTCTRKWQFLSYMGGIYIYIYIYIYIWEVYIYIYIYIPSGKIDNSVTLWLWTYFHPSKSININQSLKKNLTGLLNIQHRDNEYSQNEGGHRTEREGKEPSPIKDYFRSPFVSGWNHSKIVRSKF